MEKQKVRIPLSRKMAIMVLAFALALTVNFSRARTSRSCRYGILKSPGFLK